MKRLIVVGGGEHARVVIEVARSRADEWEVIGFVDPKPCEETERRLNVPRLGDDDAARADGDACLVLGVGSVGPGPLRAQVVARFPGARWATLIHARATVSATATLAPGVVVMAGAVVNTGANLGAHCVVNSGAIVEHDCVVGEHAQIAPGAIVSGGASIAPGAYLGAGSCVRDHVSIGRDALVGMGAVVTAAVADGETVIGVPARPWRPRRE